MTSCKNEQTIKCIMRMKLYKLLNRLACFQTLTFHKFMNYHQMFTLSTRKLKLFSSPLNYELLITNIQNSGTKYERPKHMTININLLSFRMITHPNFRGNLGRRRVVDSTGMLNTISTKC